jgi:hypothetical protein
MARAADVAMSAGLYADRDRAIETAMVAFCRNSGQICSAGTTQRPANAPCALASKPWVAPAGVTCSFQAASNPIIALTSRYSSSPNTPISRPLPDCL